MFLENVLIIFVKYPQAGFVKTRLAEDIGKVKASLLYRLFVETILARTEDTGFTRVIFYFPADKRKQIEDWIGPNLKLYPQEGDVLGDRLSYAFRFAFEKGAKRVIVIGTDSPTLDRKVVLDAFERLKNVECVLGPALDGGYYLLGLSSFYREIFKGIEWSSDKVFNQTLESLKKLKIKFSLLNEDLDIDNINDLISLRRRLPQIHKTNSADLSSLIEALDKILNDSKYVKRQKGGKNMPPLEVHLRNSKQRTGKEYEELHHWIDDDKTKSPEIHDISKIPENIRYVHEKWGEEGVREFVSHIKEDMEHRMRENFQYFGLFK